MLKCLWIDTEVLSALGLNWMLTHLSLELLLGPLVSHRGWELLDHVLRVEVESLSLLLGL